VQIVEQLYEGVVSIRSHQYTDCLHAAFEAYHQGLTTCRDICRSSLAAWDANVVESSSYKTNEAVQGKDNGDVGLAPKEQI
jgi:hypothetical protein